MDRSRHIDRVLKSLGSGSDAARSRLAASWQRSFRKHGLDPSLPVATRRVDTGRLRDLRDAQGKLIRIAAPRLDALFGLIGQSGCAVMLTDAEGFVLEHRCSDADADVFQAWGLCPGTDWSEAAEGTNGIGTCLAERRQVTIHRDEHFLARHIAMSCMDAPIYGSDGSLVAALDVSSARADQTEAFNRLIGAMVAQTAQQIEADTFRSTFTGSRIVVVDGDAGVHGLLAVDADDIVVGASREARRALGLEALGKLSPRPATDLLGRGDGPSGFERAERTAVIRALTRAHGNVSEAARALGVGRATLYRRMKRLGIGEAEADLSQN
jgi:transcriptional regulator of acetoin/glycerol metabolism